MKNLPILHTDDLERKELMGRIALSNRPSLDIDLEYIDAIAADLATDSRKRQVFVDDPTAYLSMRDLPISDCRLVASDVSMTSEACSMVVVCNANAVVAVSAATQVNVVIAANQVVAVNTSSRVNTFSSGMILHSEESLLLANSPGPYDTYGVL
jgi:hypothetical protein